MINLTDGQVVDLDTHLSGRWGPTQLLAMAADDSRTFGNDTTETCLYLIDGPAEIELESGTREVAAGTGITLIKGTRTVLTTRDPVRVFVATLKT